MLRTSTLQALAVLLIGGTGSRSAPAQAQTGRFVSIRGKDTLAVEEYARSATTLSGTVTRTNGTRIKYDAHLTTNGAVDRLTATVEGARTLSVGMWQRGDSVFVRQETDTTALAGHDVIPTLNFSYAMYEQAVRHATSIGGPSVVVHWVRVLQPPALVESTIARAGGDSATISVQGQVFHVEIDKAGKLRRIDEPVSGLVVTRTGSP